MKKLLCIILTLIIIYTNIVSYEVFAENNKDYVVETSVKINDLFLYSDTHHILVDGTVFVVGRYLIEAFGGTIDWNGETQTANIILDDHLIKMTMGSLEASVDGLTVQLYKAPFISNGRTMIPLKFISEYFGCEVTWVQETYTVNIIKDGLEIPEQYILKRNYTDEDLDLLSKIVTIESGKKSLDMSMAIANTVLNRVKDTSFPNTVYGVIYQENRYKQFPPAHKSSFKNLKPTGLSIIASKKALEGINNINGSLFFNNRPFKSKSNDLIRIINGEYFYK